MPFLSRTPFATRKFVLEHVPWDRSTSLLVMFGWMQPVVAGDMWLLCGSQPLGGGCASSSLAQWRRNRHRGIGCQPPLLRPKCRSCHVLSCEPSVPEVQSWPHPGAFGCPARGVASGDLQVGVGPRGVCTTGLARPPLQCPCSQQRVRAPKTSRSAPV